jgi:hypothetical protein
MTRANQTASNGASRAARRSCARPGLLAGLLALLGLGVLSAAGAELVTKEYQLKAAFLYNFTKFVDWPPHRFASPQAPLVIGVLGKNPFGADLAKAIHGRKQDGHSFIVTNLTSASAATGVHVLFVPSGEEGLLTNQLAQLHAADVLTVGESEAFAQAGGIITFTTEADKIRFEINLPAAETAGLKISSKLLQLAKTPRRKAPEGPGS